jgi:hypothetical protein
MSRSFRWFGLLIAALCWLIPVTSARAAESEAVAALQKLGGLPVRAGSDPATPVVKVEFNRAALTDEKLAEAVQHMKKLKRARRAKSAASSRCYLRRE